MSIKSKIKEVFQKAPRARDQLLSDTGGEVLSDKPISIPAGMKRPETLAEQVARLVRSEHLAQYARDHDMETFEESEDFDCDDDFDPFSPYETVFDPVLQKDVSPHEFAQNSDAYRKAYQKKFESLPEEQLPLPREKKKPASKAAETPKEEPQASS